MYLKGEEKMRFFEILFIGFTLLTLGSIILKFDVAKRYRKPIAMTEIGLMILSLLIDGYRWQIIPTYGLAILVIVLLSTLKGKKEIRFPKSLVVGKVVGALLAILVTISPLYAFPITQFKTPSGNYEVGTRSVMLTNNKNKKNEKDMMIQLYYPSVDNKGKFTDYSLDIDALRHELARTQGMPDMITGHMNQIKTHSYLDGKVASDETFPLLIFSHGMTLYNRQNTFQLEELASYGYVVAAVNYTKDSALTLFENQAYVPYEDKDLTLDYLDKHNLEWQADARFVLDSLLDKKNKKYDDVMKQVDTDKIGALGHSYGGATSTYSLINDDRIKAAINMDGGFYGPAIKEGDITKPFLLMNASDTIKNMKEGKDPLFVECGIRNDQVNQPGVYKLILPNTDHGSFTDLAGFSPLIAVKNADYKKTFETINQVSLGFFDQHLKGKNKKAVDSFLNEHKDIKVEKY